MNLSVEERILQLDAELAAGHHLDQETLSELELLLLGTWFSEGSSPEALRTGPPEKLQEWARLYDELVSATDGAAKEKLVQTEAQLLRVSTSKAHEQ